MEPVKETKMLKKTTKKKETKRVYAIIRCRNAGVHCGEVVERRGIEVTLAKSRRLWYWKVAGRLSFLCGLATNGPAPESKIGIELPEITLLDACEIIPCSAVAEEAFRQAKTYERK